MNSGEGKGTAIVLKNLKCPLKTGGFVIEVDHYGIYDGDGSIIHNCSGAGGVEKISADTFLKQYFGTAYKSSNSQYILKRGVEEGKIILTFPKPEDADKIVSQANALIGTAYNKLTFNCEHFTRKCFEGVARSTQVQKYAALGAVGAGVVGTGLWWLFSNRDEEQY